MEVEQNRALTFISDWTGRHPSQKYTNPSENPIYFYGKVQLVKCVKKSPPLVKRAQQKGL